MANLYGGDEVNAIVIDVGTNTVKAGYSGDDTPKAVFSSCAGVINAAAETNGVEASNAPPAASSAEATQPEASGRKVYVGSGLAYRRDDMEVVPVFTPEGLYGDMELVEHLWSHALVDRLRLTPAEHPVLLAEPSFNTKQIREKTIELLFEKLDSPAAFLAKDAVLSSYAVGRPTSLVVDTAHMHTTVSAVHDGYVLSRSVTTSPLAGQLLGKCMQSIIETRGQQVRPRHLFKRVERMPGVVDVEDVPPGRTHPSFTAHMVESLVSDVKESTCRVSDTLFVEEDNENLPTISYELPDGQQIQVGAERFKIPEIMFQPNLLNTFQGLSVPEGAASGKPLPELVVEAVNRCDVDVRRELYNGVLLVGGTSLLTGFKERMERDLLDSMTQVTAKVKVVYPPNPLERRFSVWIGGSILASLGTFQQMWMSKQEYQEVGSSLIHRRAP